MFVVLKTQHSHPTVVGAEPPSHFNNLALRARHNKSGDVHPRNGFFTLYLEEMLAAYNRRASDHSQVRYCCINNTNAERLAHAEKFPQDFNARVADLDCLNIYVLD